MYKILLNDIYRGHHKPRGQFLDIFDPLPFACGTFYPEFSKKLTGHDK